MIKPMRLQRKRSRGAKLKIPNGLPVVYVGRPSYWGNPFKATINGEGPVDYFRRFITSNPGYESDIKRELKGKNLACWCPLDKPCHADILLEVANG